MSRRVLPQRTGVTYSGIANGRAVQGVTSADAGQLGNYVAGRGRVLVPTFAPMTNASGSSHNRLPELVADGSSYRFHFYGVPSSRAWGRVWSVSCYEKSGASDSDDIGQVSFKTNEDGTSKDFRATSDTRTAEPLVWRERLSSQRAGTAEAFWMEITLPNTAGELDDNGNIVVLSIGAQEEPRVLLTGSSPDYGVDPLIHQAGAPVLDETMENYVRLLRDENLGHRMLLAWSVPATTDYARVRSSSLYSDFTGIPINMLGRTMRQSDTTRTIKFRAYHWASSASVEGNMRGNSSKRSAGTPVTLGGSTSPAWSSEGSYTIDVEDFSEADGTQSGTDDEIDLEWNQDTGTGSVYVAALCAWEELA